MFLLNSICSLVICTDLTNQNCKFDKSADGRKTIEILVDLDHYFEFIT